VVEHWSEKPGVDSSILSPATIFTAEQKAESKKQRERERATNRPKTLVALRFYGASYPSRTIDCRKETLLKYKLVYALAVVSAFSLGLNIYLMISRRQAFWSGNNAGIVQKCEGEVVSSFTGLEALEKVNDPRVEAYKKMLEVQLNAALSAMPYSEKEVKVRPLEWKILIRMNTRIYKEFYRKLGAARVAYGWQSSEPQVESRIQSVIDQYAKDGNLYGIAP
jgi:hypothetical protein